MNSSVFRCLLNKTKQRTPKNIAFNTYPTNATPKILYICNFLALSHPFNSCPTNITIKTSSGLTIETLNLSTTVQQVPKPKYKANFHSDVLVVFQQPSNEYQNSAASKRMSDVTPLSIIIQLMPKPKPRYRNSDVRSILNFSNYPKNTATKTQKQKCTAGYTTFSNYPTNTKTKTSAQATAIHILPVLHHYPTNPKTESWVSGSESGGAASFEDFHHPANKQTETTNDSIICRIPESFL